MIQFRVKLAMQYDLEKKRFFDKILVKKMVIESDFPSTIKLKFRTIHYFFAYYFVS